MSFLSSFSGFVFSSRFLRFFRRFVVDFGTKINLRELPVATANPGDARVKVGSERQAATSPIHPKSEPPRLAIQQYGICPRGPSKSEPIIWVLCFFNPKVAKMRESTCDFRRFGGPECRLFCQDLALLYGNLLRQSSSGDC